MTTGMYLYRPEDHASFESLQRNRISNVSFAVCSAGEILILAVMVGILKALKSDESTENNTKAFSVLIAFAGGVWCTLSLSFLKRYFDANDVCNTSPLCYSVVSNRETSSGVIASAGYHLAHYRFQADIRRIPRVHETEADVLVPHLLFPHGRCSKHHSVCMNIVRVTEFADFNLWKRTVVGTLQNRWVFYV